ncbi:putative cobalt transporter subunit (CbtA) [Rhodobacteraceae bacterium THAF1]|uniref:CbtA family protein n=1 Tax=Palleronia sp. THAF1 TaxID=2587842 RepID=UPI000F404B4C|nr:CbtA family protein [Palleronia sp. THAF1]QFU09737.1 putative cobalt transporter subunit (CbtA) [Palleronia sp. THAF1]VDC17360.1 putative cobalt transporter subunit (CbtA) [Rhodobacteraceae bacterium THAF1]
MTYRLLTGALIAGFAAGLLAAVLQFAFVQPVLLAAELYEGGALTHFGEDGSSAPVAYNFDPMRDILSVLFSAVVYIGYALILTAFMAVAADRGWADIDGRTGIIWGIAGFVTVQLAPAIGLPPELPGVAAADLAARQAWWLGCVVSSGIGCLLLGLGRGWVWWVGGIVLLAAPHAIGAPQPDGFTGPAPPELGALFSARALGVGLAVWAALGSLCGALWARGDA